ncbi:MAG: diguanylate cyclase/phosphodiesterase with and sensor(s) [Ilumatobacteraceae bacterium]|nr:diguanylate cyclase/phosphodiesterase with and sensor(s) [Ilumatobacteraceae bacterium]
MSPQLHTELGPGQLAEMLDGMPERVVRYTVADHVIQYCNPSWAAGHHSTPAEIRGRRLEDLLSVDEQAGLASQLSRLDSEHVHLVDPEPRRAPDAPDRWLSWSDQLLANGHEVLTIGRDVTERHLAELQLAESEARFRSLADGSPDVVFQFSMTPAPHLAYLSPSVERLLGYSSDELEADFGLFLDVIDDEGRAFVASGMSGQPIPARYDLRFTRPDGRVVIGEIQTTLLPDGLQGVGRDVTEVRTLQAELAALALRDPLTGLANRRLLDELLASALQRTQRTGTDLSIVYIDLDAFKAVNDTHGHEAGDTVLREVVQRILSTVRAADVVSRVGGDEFVIMHDAADIGDDGLVARIERSLAAPVALADGTLVRCTASIGEADTSVAGWDPVELVAAADAAMYRVKRTRRSGSSG